MSALCHPYAKVIFFSESRMRARGLDWCSEDVFKAVLANYCNTKLAFVKDYLKTVLNIFVVMGGHVCMWKKKKKKGFLLIDTPR